MAKALAALPVVLCGPVTDWRALETRPMAGERPEWSVGLSFVEANREKCFWYFTLGRWACIPFTLIGGYFCYCWSNELYGRHAALLAVLVWSFSPNVIGNAATIAPDVAGTSVGLAASYCFWRWLLQPNWTRALVAATALGLAELARTTWVILFPLWPTAWLLWAFASQLSGPLRKPLKHGCQLAAMLVGGLYLMNVGYGFEGSFQKLGDFTFISKTLAGPQNAESTIQIGANRFAGSWLAELRVPLPKNYVIGFDVQKREFEQKKWTYLGGEHRFGGWWYYYLYALAVKLPLGTCVLVLMAIVLSLARRGYSAPWRDELVLLLPAAAVLVLVSSQTGFGYFRYALPVLPFVYIWASKVAGCVTFGHWKTVAVAGAALLWSVGSSLWVYPHSLSYFNELAGGPTNGHAHLIDSNIDWGQDLLYLKRWLDKHPEARHLRLAYFGFFDPRHAGIEYTRPPRDPRSKQNGETIPSHELGPQPGWYAISVTRLRSHTKEYDYFLCFKPAAMAGYSIYIYHITLEEANRVREELGLPALSAEALAAESP